VRVKSRSVRYEGRDFSALDGNLAGGLELLADQDEGAAGLDVHAVFGAQLGSGLPVLEGVDGDVPLLADGGTGQSELDRLVVAVEQDQEGAIGDRGASCRVKSRRSCRGWSRFQSTQDSSLSWQYTLVLPCWVRPSSSPCAIIGTPWESSASSTRCAASENSEKLVPEPSYVAPRGYERPGLILETIPMRVSLQRDRTESPTVTPESGIHASCRCLARAQAGMSAHD